VLELETPIKSTSFVSNQAIKSPTSETKIYKNRTLNGSNGSGGGGFASVFTAQNIQPRVHVSPRSMIVPVPPFQHSPMLGH
uniref:hypothetical protein n=1 Tax=Salmonella enterica TaxID=28901 RepID=UPI00352516E4